MNTDDLPPGLAVEWAQESIRHHASGEGCEQCRDTFCPTAEWSLWVLVTDRSWPQEKRHSVTVVARQVMRAHLPTDGVCRLCDRPGCGRMRLAREWLEMVQDPFLPPHRLTGP